MENESQPRKKIDFDQIRQSVRASISIGFVALVLIMSFHIIKPFLVPIVWGIIISVGIYPLHVRFTAFLGKLPKLSAILITVIGLSIIAVPAALFTASTVEGISKTVVAIEDETLKVPPPNDKVKEWPIIGQWTHNTWSAAAQNLTGTLDKYKPQIKESAPKLTRAASQAVFGILLFVLAVIIAGGLLLFAKPGKEAADMLFTGLLGPRGHMITSLSITTIRSVVQGVIGIAVIQTLFLGVGMFVIKVPAAGILAILVLILAIVQLPTIVVMLPVAIYVFSVNDPLPAVLFAVWSILWSISDNLLKPLFLGKGVDVPMLVVLVGAIGGMIALGPVGLFVGSVVLTWGYKLILSLMDPDVMQ